MEVEMSSFSSLGDASDYEWARNQLQDLASRLKNAFGLEDLFNDVLFEKGVAFTPGLQMVMTVTLLEAAQAQGERRQAGTFDPSLNVEMDDVRASFEMLVDEMKSNPSTRDIHPIEKTVEAGGVSYPQRSVLSFLKSVRNRWCNIPPICE
jgi:hypothetical protein